MKSNSSDPESQTDTEDSGRKTVKTRSLRSAIQANKAIASLAMEGADPWQRIVVYASFGIILGSIIIVGLPPYTATKQLSVFGTSAGSLMVGVLLILYNYFIGPVRRSRSRKKAQTSKPNKMPRSFAVAWVFVIALSFTVTFGSRIIGYDPLWLLVPTWNQSMQSGFLIQGITDGIARNRDFVVEAVTIHARIENVKTNRGLERQTVLRTVYTLRALKQISTDTIVFTEQYTADAGEKVVYWSGSNNQKLIVDSPTNKIFHVLFAAERGENRTIVTGATIISPQTVVDTESSKEDAVFYPNDSDAVCEVNIIVESSSKLDASGTPPTRYRVDGSIQESTLSAFSTEADEATTLSARWINVLPGETVSLRFIR
ncbi:MAG TPA: hypothetical protein VJU84_11590 [Pyrinomonadaceae bacterium]|nr:hypothetical protein [Pyrinomonadaceae bacterium]